MADTILTGDITVNYLDENRQKMIEWTGSATGTRTANEFYSAMATLLDEAATGDDATAIFADTPVEYTVGVIDANDGDPWYVQYDLMEHITGGSFRTAGWDRTTGTDTGLVVIPVTNASNTFVAGDEGTSVTHSVDSDQGTLLEIIVPGGATDYLVVRPLTNAAAHDWNSVSGNVDDDVSARLATQSAAATDGEQIWANYYNVTPIDGDTHAYMYHGNADPAGAIPRERVYSVNSATQDYWARGAFDVLVPIRDFKTAANPLIDDGYKTIFARRANSLYDSFEVLASTTSGGRNPVPLKASADTNHTTGWQSITGAGGTGTFAVGDEISGDTTDARGIVTIEATGATPVIHYYPIPHATTGVLTAFNGTEAITDEDGSGDCTSTTSGPDNQGPALTGWFSGSGAPTIAHTATQFDVANEGTAENYAITIDCNQNPITEVYEWCQYILQNGGTTTASTVIEGEQYQGNTVTLAYTAASTGGLAEDDFVTQETSGATGVIVSLDETGATNYITLRDTRGTFGTGATDHTISSGGGAAEINTSVTSYAANTGAPFGTFAGGRWFLARGVVLTDWDTGTDENSWEAIPVSGGDAQSRPTSISLSVSNLRGTAITDATADLVNMHRLTASQGPIDKTAYSSDGTGAAGTSSIVVDTAIGVDEPTAGRVNIRDESDNNAHYMVRYASWATSTFTLAAFGSFTATGGSTTTVDYATGGFNAGVKRGDLVYASTGAIAGQYSYVVTVDSDTSVTVSPAFTASTSGETIDFNVLPIALDTLDDVYPSLISEYALTGTESVSIVYDAQIFYRVKVSNTRHTTKQRRFVTDGSTSGTDQNTPNILNTDSIFS